MKKPTLRPIAMRCNKEQLESVRDILQKEGIRISEVSNNWYDHGWLVNNFMGSSKIVSNIHSSCKEDHDRTVFEEWNKNTFLEYCGIQVLPEKWAIKACKEVGHWLNENSDMPVKNRANDYSVTAYDYLVYPSHNKSHMYDRIPQGYAEITIEEFREITKTNKPMSQQKLTVPISEVLEIHKIACQTWKSTIGKYLSRVDEHQMITFTQEELDKMFAAATADQRPVLIRIFGEKVEIDYDKIKTGSKVMLKHTQEHVEGIGNVDLRKPFDVVFFKSKAGISADGLFSNKWKGCASYATFHQDGRYVLFASNENLDYIVSVIEY